MKYFLILFVSVMVSIIVIPLMMRLAPRLGMIDYPDERRVHVTPTPRVGGWGIVFGMLVPVLIWLPLTPTVFWYLFGALTLLVFGSLDDRHHLSPAVKFAGQLLAITPLALWGGMQITTLPILGDSFQLPSSLAIPFAIFAVAGMTNALNTSDGLDGLAGGEALLSLGAIGLLAYLDGGHEVAVIAVAAVGGILGFLRYNTHPANVFMGDSGSQFIGFTLGFLAIMLTQNPETEIQPAVVLLLLGLPIADLLVVMLRRRRRGDSMFRPSKDHFHHLILNLGFSQHGSVGIMYLLQTLFVFMGGMLAYTNDFVILLVYVILCVGLVMTLRRIYLSGWRKTGSWQRKVVERRVRERRATDLAYSPPGVLVWLPRRMIEFGVPVYLVVASLAFEVVPRDIGILAAFVFVAMLAELIFNDTPHSLPHRFFVYAVAATVVFLQVTYPPVRGVWARVADIGFFIVLAIGLVTAMIYSPKRRKIEFFTTTMDYLLVFAGISLAILSQTPMGDYANIALLFYLGILFYGCEFINIEKRDRWNELAIGSMVSAGILGIKGLFITG